MAEQNIQETYGQPVGVDLDCENTEPEIVSEDETSGLNSVLNAISPYSIIGSDNRTTINSRHATPYSAICYLVISWPNGASGTATGFVVGYKTIATAGHCVYDKACGGWASSIKIYYYANGNSTQKSMYASSLASTQGYVYSDDSNYDYGVITTSSEIGKSTKMYKMLERDWISSDLTSTITIAGYRANVLYSMYGSIASAGTYKIYTQIDTEPGQSGCPYYRKRNGYYEAIGIHNGSSGSSQNVGIKIRKSIYDYYNNYASFSSVNSSYYMK